MYDIENLYQASAVEDAIRALKEDPSAVVISGGSDVLIQIREGKLAGCSLVSIQNIKELKEIVMETDRTIRIGAGTSFSHLTNHALIREYLPVLGEAADQVGSPQIRKIGTIGGNVCNGVTSADSAATLFALNAKLELTGAYGKREVPIAEFYIGPGKTVREHEELLTAICIGEKDYKEFQGHYIKYGKRNAMEIATLGCVVLVKLTEDKKKLEEVRIAYGVAAPVPIRCPQTEDSLRGRSLNENVEELIGKGVLEEVNPRSSWRASKEFRLQLIEELSKRALKEAVCRAGGELHV